MRKAAGHLDREVLLDRVRLGGGLMPSGEAKQRPAVGPSRRVKRAAGVAGDTSELETGQW